MNRFGQLAVIIGGIVTAFLIYWNFQHHSARLNQIFEQQAKLDAVAEKASLKRKLDAIENALGEIVRLIDYDRLGNGFHRTEKEFELIAGSDELSDAIKALANSVQLIDLVLTHHTAKELNYSLTKKKRTEPDALHIRRHYEWIEEDLIPSKMASEARTAIVSSVANGVQRQIYYSIPLLNQTKERAIMMITLVLDLQEIVKEFRNGRYLEVDGYLYHFREDLNDTALMGVDSELNYKEDVTDIGMRRLWGEWAVGNRGGDNNLVSLALDEAKKKRAVEYSVLTILVLMSLAAIEAGIRRRQPLAIENSRLSKIVDEKEREIALVKENSRAMSYDLLDSEVRLHSIIGASTDGIVVCGKDREIKSVNLVLKSMLGYEDDHDIVGKSIEFIFPELDSVEHGSDTALFDRAKANNPLVWTETNALSKENQFISVGLFINRVKVGDNEALSIVVRDISERIKDKDEIRDVQENLRAVIDNVAEGIVTSDSKGIVRTFNSAAEKMFGWKSDEIIGKNVTVLMTGDDRERHDNYLRRYIDIGKSNILGAGPREVIGARKCGEIFHMEIATSEMIINNECVFIAIVRDITERKIVEKNMHMSYSELESLVDSHTEDLKAMNKELVRARDEALVAARSKSGFLAMMSHEIRTPINGVLGMLSLVRETHLDHTQRDYIETAYACGESLLELLNDVLDLSKIDAGRMYLDSSMFDLYQVVEKSVYLTSRSLHEQDIEVTCFIDHDVPRFVNGDNVRLRQVLTNLTSNAVKFTRHGEVSIRVKRERDCNNGKILLSFEVTDTGIGIEEVDLERIFEEFSQVDSSERRNYGGTGLGLTISKRIVSLMGGKITVKSRVGEGSTFTFSASFILSDQFEGMACPDKYRVILIAENEIRRRAHQRQLLSWGIEVTLFSAGEISSMPESQNFGEAVVIIDVDSSYRSDQGFMKGLERIISQANGILIVSDACATKALVAESENRKVLTITSPVLPTILYEKLDEMSQGMQDSVKEELPVLDDSEYDQLDSVSVLVAEDNQVNQKVINGMLKRIGVNVEIVENGREAFDLLSESNGYFDIVLMDCQMPEMDGYTATRCLRQYEKEEGGEKRIPIIAMTAHALPGDREKCLDAGMDDYITKPIKIEIVQEIIERWLDQ